MKTKFIHNFAKLVAVPSLVLAFSIGAAADNQNDYVSSIQSTINSVTADSNQLQKIIVTPEQKSLFAYVAQKINELKLPKELVLIPVIESEYKCSAVSNKGAGGLWQLMPATAKDFGISSSDRFQVGPSTMAALTYFSQLHQQFGNWEFAIAAYNAGSGRVEKALKQNPSATSVQQLNLPKETKQYVQKFYAMQNDLRSYSA